MSEEDQHVKMNIKQEIENDGSSIYNNCLPVIKEVADCENPANTSAVKIEEENVDIKEENDENYEHQHLVETGAYYPVPVETESNHIIGQPTTLLIDKKQTQQRAYAPRAGGYRCVTCGDKFKWKKSLEQHTKKHETDDRQVETTSQSVIAIKQELNHCETGHGQLATPNLTLHIKTGRADDIADAGDIHTERTSLDAQHSAQIAVETKLESEADATCATETICDSERAAVLPLEDIYTNKPEVYRCHICYVALGQESLLASHIKTHKEKQFMCSVCGFVSVSENGLRTHGKSAHGSSPVWHLRTAPGEKLHECSVCDFKAITKSYLRIHEKRHSGKISCEDTANHLRVDVGRHTEEVPYHCSVCDYTTSQLGSLLTHVRTHTDEKLYECAVCDFGTASLSTLRKHRTVHTGEKLYGCYMCDFKTTRQRTLTEHWRKHTGEKPYECSVCNFKTAYNSALWRHSVTHIKKQFECSICEFKTFYKKSLTVHMRRHTENRIYKCMLCGCKTSTRRRLIRHLKSHSKLKRYECSVCDFKCAYNISLITHMQQHKSENIYVTY